MTHSEKERSTGDLLAGIESHLQMIEAQYPLTITNKDQVAERILGKTHDPRCILSIALSLNHWAAVNGITGDVVIPEKVLDLILQRVCQNRSKMRGPSGPCQDPPEPGPDRHHDTVIHNNRSM